jgi:hypothetical protein
MNSHAELCPVCGGSGKVRHGPVAGCTDASIIECFCHGSGKHRNGTREPTTTAMPSTSSTSTVSTRYRRMDGRCWR